MEQNPIDRQGMARTRCKVRAFAGAFADGVALDKHLCIGVLRMLIQNNPVPRAHIRQWFFVMSVLPAGVHLSQTGPVFAASDDYRHAELQVAACVVTNLQIDTQFLMYA